MYQAIQEEASDLNCKIVWTKAFATGSSKWEYLVGDLQNTKIGLCPGGSSVENHRLAETLIMGSVPALLDERYIHAAFRDLPGIIGTNWTVVAKEMKRLLKEENDSIKHGEQSELQRLQEDGSQFYHELQLCMQQDMEALIQIAIDHYAKK
jgi:hypothetical protein